MHWLTAESERALAAVIHAKDYFLHHNQTVNVGVKKWPRDLVTDLDIKIERELIKLLQKSSYPIIGEESRTKRS